MSQQSAAIPEVAFLDTEVFVAASFNLDTTAFQELRKHVASGRLRMITTDITIREIHANIRKSVEAEITAIQSAQRKARVLRSSDVPALQGALETLDVDEVVKKAIGRFDEFITGMNTTILETDDLEVGDVMEKYFANEPPFGSGDKKHEFPDAFVVQRLVEWADGEDEDLLTVSADKPIGFAFAECDGFHHKESLAALLDHIASDNEKLAAFIRARLVDDQILDEIAHRMIEEFGDLEFYVDQYDGEVEIDTYEHALVGEPEILKASAKAATAQLGFDLGYSGDLRYDDPDSGYYDSEDDRRYSVDKKREGFRKMAKVVVEVSVVLEGTDPEQFQVENVTLVKPKGPITVKTHYWEGYPWK